MACPFFMPVERFEGGAWLHPSRLPLGDGWRGYCTAGSPETVTVSDQQLQDCCNLGYAKICERLPLLRISDAVRFSVARVSEKHVLLRYVCELDHHPVEFGTLEFARADGRWTQRHSDARIQKMAECYLDAYTRRTESSNPATTPSVAS